MESAIEAVGAGEILARQGPLTVLAPVNEAFDVLDQAYPWLVDVLLTESWELHLLDMLSSHIVDGKTIMSSDLADGVVLFPMGSQESTVRKTDSAICFTPSLSNAACVVLPDLVASNGVAHALDGTCIFWVLISRV